MPDVLTPVSGSPLTIEAFIPGAIQPLLVFEANLSAQLTALLNFAASVSLDFGAQLTLLADIEAAINLAVSLALEPPSLSVQLSITAALVLAIEAQLALIVALFALLANAGVFVWAYDGTAGGLGATVTTALTAGLPGGTGPSEHVNALVAVTAIGATWTAMGGVFKVS